MQSTTVTAQYVNPPKGRGPASIKATDGKYYRFWTKKIPVHTFQQNGTYNIGFHTEVYNGEDQYYIDEVINAGDAGATYAAAPKANLAAPQQFSPEKVEDISVLAIVKCMQPLPVGDVAAVEHALKTAALGWRRFKEWQKNKNIETGPRRSMKDELDDDLPETLQY